MLKFVDLYQETTDFHGVGRVFFTRVPAFSASSIVWECRHWRGIAMTYARHPFDEQLALDLIRHVRENWDGSMGGKGMRILPGLRATGRTPMDVAVLLRPPHLAKVGTVDPALDAYTVFCFPAYEGEFSGEESPDEFDERIHTRADIGDWNRRRGGSVR